MKVNVTQSKNFRKGIDEPIQTFKLYEMISYECYDRIFNRQIVSNEIFGVVACMSDRIKIQVFDFIIHKE